MSQLAQQVGQQAELYLNQGYHCSEGVALAVAPVFVANWHQDCLKLSTCFAGGVAGTQMELCGALAGSVMVIGALYGRSHLQDDTHALDLAGKFRQFFEEKYASTQCRAVRENVVIPEGSPDSCSILAGEVAALLVDFLIDQGAQPLEE